MGKLRFQYIRCLRLFRPLMGCLLGFHHILLHLFCCLLLLPHLWRGHHPTPPRLLPSLPLTRPPQLPSPLSASSTTYSSSVASYFRRFLHHRLLYSPPSDMVEFCACLRHLLIFSVYICHLILLPLPPLVPCILPLWPHGMVGCCVRLYANSTTNNYRRRMR